jgi:SAM-dependent methyltransferase
MIETIEFEGEVYPAFQASGNASRFILRFAQEVCRGDGLDIGPKKITWTFPGAIPIDPKMDWEGRGQFTVFKEISKHRDAMNIPIGPWDYIFSSHCLEHINESWDKVLDYWLENLKPGGVMFLYLPHPDQKYWLPWNNDKHVHIIYPKDLLRYFKAGSYCNIFVSKRDLNHSFTAMAQKL